MNPLQLNVRISPAHRRSLGRVWQRLKAEGRADADAVTTRQMSDIIHPDGTLRARAIGELDGDVTGALTANQVEGLQGRPVLPTLPTDGQALVYNASLGAWEPGAGGGSRSGGRWEPVTNGDAVSPELVFDDFGDVVVSWVEG